VFFGPPPPSAHAAAATALVAYAAFALIIRFPERRTDRGTHSPADAMSRSPASEAE
jgi:hypothetical protein